MQVLHPRVLLGVEQNSELVTLTPALRFSDLPRPPHVTGEEQPGHLRPSGREACSHSPGPFLLAPGWTLVPSCSRVKDLDAKTHSRVKGQLRGAGVGGGLSRVVGVIRSTVHAQEEPRFETCCSVCTGHICRPAQGSPQWMGWERGPSAHDGPANANT